MAGEWRETTIGEFAPFAYGKALPEHRRDSSGDVHVFGSNGVVGFHGEALTSGPTVIIGRKGTVGAVHYSRNPCWPIDTTFYVVDPDPEVLRFKYYLLKSLDLEHMNADSAVPGLNRDAAHALKISVPPLPEQRAIAHILGTLDDKIELNRRMSQTLEAMARALFKAWFVDFEPVRAKMEGRWQRGQSLPGLPAHLYDLFPDRLVDSELGEIPEGWRVVELEQVIEINPPRVLRRGQCAPYLDMASMPTRGHVPLRVVERPYTSGTRFTNGDTLLARITPCLENGKTAFVDFLAPNEVGWGSTEFIVLRPKPPLPAEFGYCLARDPDFREFAIQSMTGTSGRQRVQPEALARYLLVVPSDGVAKAFGALVEPWFRKASASERESRTLAALRDALLPKLIRGEIRVKDAERFLKERGL
jgi:type I restriction enzyme S subunit